MKHINSFYEIHIKGLVQGVGFRPFIYRCAMQENLTGWVENRNHGVVVKVKARYPKVEKFVKIIKEHAPIASSIKDIQIVPSQEEKLEGFKILNSKNKSEAITEISPDIAVCFDCLEDIKIQPRRINYPFTNCTNCGPRFSIIKDIPYDRENTTMEPFEMCEDCRSEYEEITDRRFHAQPVSCNFCGPQYELYQHGRIIKDIYKIVQEVKKTLYRGKIIAVKGVGGYHLMCDATNFNAVKKLRSLKDRDNKPFAVMFSNFEVLKDYAYVNKAEREILLSWRRPVVLLREKRQLNSAINDGLRSIGVMLPYMPLHFIMFEEIDLPAIVLTSANPSEQPIIKDDKVALDKLSSIASAFLIYDREIFNRSDDSVVQFTGKQLQLIRRSRGYVPSPIDLSFDATGVLATGAELKNTFAIGKGRQVILSQHIGDLKNFETYDFYTDTIDQFLKLFRVNPDFIVSDMHPDYLSTKYARNYKSKNITKKQNFKATRPKWIQVQHHHAHIASCMAEYNLDEKVIGIALDGTGYGDDGKIWGGEFFVCNYLDYQRFAHLEYTPMPGGDKAVHSPWRMALAYLYKAFGDDLDYTELEFLKEKSPEDIKLILSMIRKELNSPLTSSTGRLFDAVSAMLNLCTDNCYEAEAPMKLEAIISDNIEDNYSFTFEKNILSFSVTIREILEDLKDGTDKSVISAKFHNTIAMAAMKVSQKIRESTGLNKVVLSGGSFQNRYLTDFLKDLLEHNKFEVFTNHLVPPNDGGISLGQIAIGTKKLKE
ncbi:MAG: carbamoyltransferase HypF [Bacteroidales bacterium]